MENSRDPKTCRIDEGISVIQITTPRQIWPEQSSTGCLWNDSLDSALWAHDWLLDQITWNRPLHACSQCQLGDNHQPHCNRLKHIWHRNENSPYIGTRDQIIKCDWFYVWRQKYFDGGVQCRSFSQAIVDVQCWCLIWTESAEHCLPHAALLILLGVRYDKGARYGWLGQMISGLPKMTSHRISSLMRNTWCRGRCGLWTNGEPTKNRWQVSASE